MNNHKIYNEIESGITYKVLKYMHDDKKDYKFINKFINKYDNCKIIILNFISYIPDDYPYHPYYFPGLDLSKITYYKNKKIILEIKPIEFF